MYLSGAICLRAQIKSEGSKAHHQRTAQSSLARKCGTGEEPCTQLASGLPQPAGTPKKQQKQNQSSLSLLRNRKRNSETNMICVEFLPEDALPSVPRDTKLSKLDVLVLATNYIAYLTQILDQGRTLSEYTLPPRPGGYLHPVKVKLRCK